MYICWFRGKSFRAIYHFPINKVINQILKNRLSLCNVTPPPLPLIPNCDFISLPYQNFPAPSSFLFFFSSLKPADLFYWTQSGSYFFPLIDVC